MNNFKPLPQSFFERDTIEVAKSLLGKYLVRWTREGVMVAKFVEVEAYLGVSDPACHAYVGITLRTAVFFGKAGIAYVFVIYGIHHCLNVITLPESQAGCVLIRAVEPISGINLMKKNRRIDSEINLTNGPGKLTKALLLDRSHTGMDMTDPKSSLLITEGENSDFDIEVTKRVGINKAKDDLLRFYIKDNPFVSYPRNPGGKSMRAASS